MAAFCGYQVYHHYSQVAEQTEAFEKIAEVADKSETSAEEIVPDDTPVNEGDNVLTKYKELHLHHLEMLALDTPYSAVMLL